MCIRGLQILLHVFVRSTRDCLFHTGEHRTSLLDRSCSRILWVSSSHKGKGSPSQQTLCAGLCDLMSLYRKPRHFGEKRILVAAYLFGWALMSRWKFTRKTSKVCKRNAARVVQWELLLRWYHMEDGGCICWRRIAYIRFSFGSSCSASCLSFGARHGHSSLWLNTRGAFQDGSGFVGWCRTVFHNHIVWRQRAERNFKTKFLLPRDSVRL